MRQLRMMALGAIVWVAFATVVSTPGIAQSSEALERYGIQLTDAQKASVQQLDSANKAATDKNRQAYTEETSFVPLMIDRWAKIAAVLTPEQRTLFYKGWDESTKMIACNFDDSAKKTKCVERRAAVKTGVQERLK